jgi:type I restriction enzyme R subunit
MTMGAGKTFTAVSREFQDYATPDDGRKFTQIYNVQYLTSNILDPVCRVSITTIQRLYSMLKDEPEFNPDELVNKMEN